MARMLRLLGKIGTSILLILTAPLWIALLVFYVRWLDD